MSVDPVSAFPSRPSPGAAGAQLGELYAAHARMVYGVCRMLLRDADEAEDTTQQVFLAAYRNLLTGTEVRDPAAWLGTIARNACRRRAVARKREPLATGEEPTLVAPAADEAAIGREDAAALYAQLASLPEKQREAIVLRDVYGLRYDEVAKALGTSRPAVEALLFRGRRRLQRRLRPGLAAGVLVVPLAIQESIAYAVPGFASTAAPAGAAVAAGIPLAAKLAAAGSAVAIAGSAGVVAERSLHDPPARPPDVAPASAQPVAEADAGTQRPVLLPVPAGGFPVLAATRGDDDHSGPGRGGEDRAAADDDEDEDENEQRGHDGEDHAGPGRGGGDEVEHEAEHRGEGGGGDHEDDSGPGGGAVDGDGGESGSSGHGSGGDDAEHDD